MSQDLARIRAFVQVFDAGGFSSAARQHGRSKALLSKYVTDLEDYLGVRLMNRTTRKLSLTEAGEAYYREASQLLQQLDGLDLALRISTMTDSSLIARKIADMRVVVAGAPSLVAARGRPMTPEALRNLPCIIDTNLQGQANWRFVEDGKTLSIHVSGPVRVNSPLAALQAATMGLGFAVMPSYLADPAIESGELVSVLESFVPDGQTLQAVYPHRRHLAGKVRALIDHLVQWFERHLVP